jgi:hypothetical protein
MALRAVASLLLDTQPVSLRQSTLLVLNQQLLLKSHFILLHHVILYASLSYPDHREPLFLYGEVDQGVTGGYSSYFFLCGVLGYYFYVGDLYDSKLEAAGNRCL